jgi:phosphopantothenoylcysteine decarboxylase/phosphopantothenate--cysteine ligase
MGSSPGEDLTGKTVVYGITGGIAAYKAPLVVRGLKALGVDVHVVVTDAARYFVTPTTLQTLSCRPVYAGLFPETPPGGAFEVEHVSLADRADLLLIAPATADFIAKAAHGAADDLLSCVALATKAPILLCPSMNVNMYRHPATRENIEILTRRGVHVLEPASGELACGWEGEGRLPEPGRIVDETRKMLYQKDFSGISVLVTCGPTCEDIDPVRFITNRSTGRMGAALVEAAALRGGKVKVISGPVHLEYAPWADVIRVRSAAQMLDAVREQLDGADILIMAAAVADYVPETCRGSKIKKGDRLTALPLTASPDILSTIRPIKNDTFFVGFAAETENLSDSARGKLTGKGLDMIVANRVGEPGTGFAAETNSGMILSPEGVLDSFEQMDKGVLAHKILDFIRERV